MCDTRQLPKVRYLGQCDYLAVLQAMQQFTQERTSNTQDEIWLLSHHPIYTLGQRATWEDISQLTDIPVVHTDRGGRITYHGPGQLVMYPLLNLRRLAWHLRQLVDALEHSVIELLADHQITAYTKAEAPGVYIQAAKVASLGIRIRKGYCYHGLALNLNMDLDPFKAIHPCGLSDIQMTQLADWMTNDQLDTVPEQLLTHFKAKLFTSH